MLGLLGGVGGGGGASSSNTAAATSAATIGPTNVDLTGGAATGQRGVFYNNAFSPGSTVGGGGDTNAPEPYLAYVKWAIIGLFALLVGSAIITRLKG